uniref:SPOR domain-containing protein n=1 Tax=Stomoxys calcitrans TaxID=35570 RepID=A0A1I8PFM4_STOCA
MLSFRKLLPLLMLVLVIGIANHKSWALPIAEAEPSSSPGNSGDGTKLLVISEDVIPDEVEMDQKKVIRVNPLDLPPIKEDPNKKSEDSSLYKIQSIKPFAGGKRKYANSQNMRKPSGAGVSEAADTPITRGLPAPQKFVKPKHQPKKKHLHFLYNQDDLSGNLVAKTMRVHTAPGAYPVFYAVAKTNGRFGKYPLKSFSTPQAFKKYIQKNKLENAHVIETAYEER